MNRTEIDNMMIKYPITIMLQNKQLHLSMSIAQTVSTLVLFDLTHILFSGFLTHFYCKN